jgi:acetylornithine deacetylase/succinyl-diaminopimelate desuccinylase family protein
MIRLTRELVAIPTENPPGQALGACAETLARELRALDLEPHLVAASAPAARPILLAGWGEGERSLHFHGHYDVVPASRPGQFDPVERAGRLYGRGTADMKSGLAAMIYATQALARAGARLDGRIRLVLVPDEETGGAHGSAHLLERGILGHGAVGMLTPEPTSGVVWNACRGALSLRLTTRGTSAHIGLQHQGVNAFASMVPIARALFAHERAIRRRITRHRLRPAAARRSILLVGGRVEAGSNFNAVPGECTLTVDRRMNPEEDFERERRRLLEVIERARPAGARLQIDVLQEGRPAATPESDPLARALRASVREVTGRAPRLELCPGLLEIRFYAQRSVPALAFGPGRLDVSHGPDEFVELDEIERCARVYALTALRMLGKPAVPSERARGFTTR